MKQLTDNSTYEHHECMNVQKEVEANVLGDLEEHSETDIPQMTKEEVELAVKKLQDGQAAGEDEILADEKNEGKVMIDRWDTVRTNQVPSEWKKSILVPVHKKERNVCNNYHGISLLSIPGTVLSPNRERESVGTRPKC